MAIKYFTDIMQRAIVKANKLSHKTGREYFVVYSPDEFDIPGNDYHVCNEFDLDTFYDGCQVIFSTYEV